MSRRPHRSRPRRAHAGFTLLEVMAALSVFLVGIVSVLALLSAGTRLHQESQNMGLTADTAEEVLLLATRELAERAPAAGSQEAPPDSGGAQPVPSRPELNYQWSVRAAPGGGLYLLLVEVTWLEAGKPRKLTLQRVLPRLQSPSVDARRLVTGNRS
jgi:prepilin-type N-terminal cleavage/methylation domain-containing protein